MKRIFIVIAMMAMPSSLLATETKLSYYTAQEIAQLDHGNMSHVQLMGYIRSTANRDFHGLGYRKGAKPALFQQVDLKRDKDGYYIKDVYCNFIIRNHVGPRKRPNNNVMNVEHTWPQSHGSKREPFRGDLHHLFPSDTRANSARGNHPFGEVANASDATDKCSSSQKGKILNPKTNKPTTTHGFQPPHEHRGNVARALFYGAVFYGHQISQLEEYYLRKWHNEDPADAEEIARNDAIQKLQGNRNPFVDFPGLVERIRDF